MRKFNFALVALLALVLTSGLSFAQRGGGHKGPGKGGPRPDSTHSGPKLPGGPMGPFGMSDSCFKVFLSLIPADQAATISDDMAKLNDINTQAQTLRGDLKTALQAKDTAAIHRIMDALRGLFKQASDLKKAIDQIVRTNQATLLQVRKDCMGFGDRKPEDTNHVGGGKDTLHRDDTTHHHKGPGSGGDPSKTELKVTPVVPNPVLSGSPASFTYSIVGNTTGTQVQVDITISDAMGNLVKTVSSGLVDPGDHQVTLDLSGMAPGVYILRIQAAGMVASQKIMIQ